MRDEANENEGSRPSPILTSSVLATPELEIARNLPPEGCSVQQAQRYTRWLATHHYENFGVVSWLLPRHLHQHFYNVYSYCRWSDDLGDEVRDQARAVQLLDAWENELRLIYQRGGSPSHPVLIALRETARAKNIPIQPFTDLLRAFRQDQTVKRYATWEALLDYCVYSANPVGRLVLYLCGYRDRERQRLSDYTCTALQLANFWQDVSRDLEKGRIYIPLNVLAAHNLTETDIIERRFDERYVALMKEVIARTYGLFLGGLRLVEKVDGALRTDIELFSCGGLAVLDAIESAGYNTLYHRPELTRSTKLWLLAKAFGSRIFKRTTAKDTAAFLSNAGSFASPPADPANSAAAVELADARSVAASYGECNRIARAARSSFYLAFFGLPKS